MNTAPYSNGNPLASELPLFLYRETGQDRDPDTHRNKSNCIDASGARGPNV